MDLAGLKGASDGTLILRDHNGEELKDEATGGFVSITLAGPDSAECLKAEHEALNRRMIREINIRGASSRTKKRLKLTAEELDQDAIQLLARITRSWSNIQLNGETLECNFDNAVKLYSSVPAVRQQVDEFHGDRENFLGN